MATARTIMFAIILLAPSMALAQSGSPITALAPLPHKLSAASAVWDGSGVVVFGGMTPSGPTDEILRYDPSADAWTPMSSKLPVATAYTSAVWTGTEALIFGVNDLVLRYDPAHDSLNTMDARLPTARTHAGAAWSGAAAYVFGGQTATGAGLREILRVVPGTGTSGSVTKLSAALDATVNETVAVWTGQNAIVFGASAPSTDPGYAWSYDPATQIVRAGKFLGNSRGFGSAMAFDGTDIYQFGGQFSGFGYYESGVRWRSIDGGARLNDYPFGSGRADIAVAWDGTSAYLVGGIGDRGAMDALVRFTPSLTSGGAQPKPVGTESGAAPSSPTPAPSAPRVAIQTLRPMPTQLSGAAAVTDGSTIFVFGGDTANGATNAILRYDVGSDTWTTDAARLPGAMSNATAVWTGTRAIIAGGSDRIVSFDPRSDVATLVAHLPAVRRGAASIFDGTYVWILGGDVGAGATADIIRFDPATNEVQTMAQTLVHPTAYMGYAWTGSLGILAGGQDRQATNDNGVMVGIAFDPRAVSSRETGGYQSSKGMGSAYVDDVFYEIGGVYGHTVQGYDNGIGRVEVDVGGSPVPNTRLDPGRAFASVVRVGRVMIVMGGETQNGKIDSVVKLDPTQFPGYTPPASPSPAPAPAGPTSLPDHDARVPRDVTWLTNHWQIDGHANGCALQDSQDHNHVLTALLQDFDGTISGKDPATGATVTKTGSWSFVVTQLSSNMPNGCNNGRIVSDGQSNDELGYLVAMNLSWTPVITPDHNVFALPLGPGSTNSASGTASACAQIGGGQGTVAITGFSGDVVGRNATSPTMDFNAIPGTGATSTTQGSFDLILARPATYTKCDTSGISMSGTSFGTLLGLRFAGAAAPSGGSTSGAPPPGSGAAPPTARTPCYDLLSCPIGDISSLRSRISNVRGEVLTAAGAAVVGAPILLLGQQQNALKLISLTQTASDGSFNVPISAVPPAYAATVLGGHVVMQDLTQVQGGIPSDGRLDIKLPVSAAAASAQATGGLTSSEVQQLKDAFQDAKPYGIPSVSTAQPAHINTDGYAGISGVSVATRSPQSDARLMVVALNGKGSDKIPDPPEGKPERYFALQLTDTQGNELPLQTMTISFAAPADSKGKDVELQHFRLDTQRWETLPTRVDPNGTYFADVDSLSLFAVSTSQPTALAALLSSAFGSRWTLPVVGGVIVLGVAVAVVNRARATRSGRAAPKPGAAAAVGLRAAPLPEREALIADLSVNAKSTKILQNVSFSFHQGEILALLGPSGSGKSTLLKALLGEISFSGEASLFGIDPARRDPAFKKLIGYVSQETELYPDMTLRENVEYFGKQYGLSAKDLKDRVGPLLETLGLTERAQTRVGLLSGGQQRRASIAATLVHAPSLLILDEPTSGLDPVTRKSLWKFVRQASRELGVTVIVTTHFLDEADLADRVVILNKGSVVKAGTPQELVRSLPGGGRAVVVELQSSSPAIEARVRDAVRPLTERGTIAAVDLSGYTARFFTANSQAASRELLDAFGHADVPVKQVTTEDCGMDAVFTYYAGERWKETDDA